MSSTLLSLVADIKLADFEEWLEKQAATGFPRRFLAGDECACPLAQWLCASSGEPAVYVSDDSVTDADLMACGDLPMWAYRFVRRFDSAFHRPFKEHPMSARAVLQFLQRIKLELEDLDGPTD